MTITLILLIGWILILNTKPFQARWIYALLIALTVIFLFLLALPYMSEDWTGYQVSVSYNYRCVKPPLKQPCYVYKKDESRTGWLETLVLLGLPHLIDWLSGYFDDCDGSAASEVIAFSGNTLQQWTQATGSYTKSDFIQLKHAEPRDIG